MVHVFLQIHFLRSILRRPHTDRISEGVKKRLRRNRNRDSCGKSATGTENTGIRRIPTGICNLAKKDDPNRLRLTIGGDRLNVPGDWGTPTVDMVTVKLHLNSVISTKGACYCTIDLKDFYLMTPMTHPEYIRSGTSLKSSSPCITSPSKPPPMDSST
jgi:hypothetical protein